MAVRARNRVIRKPTTYTNWLKQLDIRTKRLSVGLDWREELGPQRCRRFIMARFPKLLRLLPEEVLSDQLSLGENLIRGSRHAKRVLDELDVVRIRQLAGLILDVIEAVDFYLDHRGRSQTAQKLAAEADRRTRMLASKASKLRNGLKSLGEYAEGVHPLLRLKYARAADKCLKILFRLREDPFVPFALEIAHSLRVEYPTLQDPRQLGIVQLYWFFRHECELTCRESEVRAAILANEFLATNLAYIPDFNEGEKGCPAVRQAVRRYSPCTSS